MDGTDVWTSAIAGVVTLLVAYMGHHFNQKLLSLSKVGEATHTLVNSNMGVQLRLCWMALSRVASLTKDPVDIESSNTAEKAYKEHVEKQAVVDAQVAKV